MIVEFLQNAGIPPWLATLLLAMMPIFELRGAIPVGNQVLGLPLSQAVTLSVIGNMLPIVPILLLLGPVSKGLSRWKPFRKFFEWLFARTRSKSDVIRKYELIGLMLFVSVPLPVTGAWTGAVAAFLFGIRFWPALGAIFLGVLIAGTIITTLVLMGIWGAIVAGLALSFLAAGALWRSVRSKKV
ncbi:MAG: small multi-drug export protein [Candidatus Aminicenantes bacterium]|nr:small multi-drug export protein [Candidatus Aminicenantes bacterium]